MQALAKPNVFISYSHSDSNWVDAFAEALRSEKIPVWFDKWNVAPGDSLQDALSEGIRQAKFIVSVLSDSTIKSPQSFFEIGAALGMKKKLIPIVPDGMKITDIPFDLRTRKYVHMGTPEETAKIVASAVKQLKSEPEK